jgi:hypothetical protein
LEIHDLNWLVILVGGIIIFLLGGLWYSPLMFSRQWTKLHGKTGEDIQAGEGSAAPKFVLVFLSGLVTSFVIAFLFHIFRVESAPQGIHIAALFWFGFTGPAMFATSLFSFKPWKLWLIDSSYYLVAYIIVGAMHAVWH